MYVYQKFKKIKLKYTKILQPMFFLLSNLKANILKLDCIQILLFILELRCISKSLEYIWASTESKPINASPDLFYVKHTRKTDA